MRAWRNRSAKGSDADSASDHQLLAAIDAEDGLLATGNGVLALGAGLDCQPRVHDAAAVRAMADGSIGTPMIHVLARVGMSGDTHAMHLTAA